MKKISIATLSVILLFTMTSCPTKWGYEDYRLKIKNNSSINLYYCEDFFYPDTLIKYSDISKVPSTYKIGVGKEQIINAHSSWENMFKQVIHSDTLMIFIFDATTIESTPWDTVKSKYMILKRYDLSYDDLVRMNWTITYP
jgi:hypothetical protein